MLFSSSVRNDKLLLLLLIISVTTQLMVVRCTHYSSSSSIFYLESRRKLSRNDATLSFAFLLPPITKNNNNNKSTNNNVHLKKSFSNNNVNNHNYNNNNLKWTLFESNNPSTNDDLNNKQTKKKRVQAKKKKKSSTTNDDMKEVLENYWQNDQDEFIWKNSTFSYSSFSTAEVKTPKFEKVIRFVIRGNPSPLARHRSSRGFTYNPSAKKQQEFREVFTNIIIPKTNTIDPSSLLLFPEGEYLAATIIFRLKRPKNHFVANRPGEGRIRAKSPQKLHGTRSDVDNLAKFVLDALNGVLYADDRQIVSLYATKVLDCEENCEGATEITLHSVNDKDIEQVLDNQMNNIYSTDNEN